MNLTTPTTPAADASHSARIFAPSTVDLRADTGLPFHPRPAAARALFASAASRPSLLSAECHVIPDMFDVCIVPPRPAASADLSQENRG